MNALYTGSRNLVLRVHTLGSHADGEETEVGETYALAVEDEFLQAVECVHQNSVDSASGVRRVVLGYVGHEILKAHFSVGYGGGVPHFLVCIFSTLWSAGNFTILQCSSFCHNFLVFKGLII